jgi:oligopeptide transport system ATP-binding protein
MFGGNVMESQSTQALFDNPRHPYTRGLLEAVPRLDRDVDVLATVSYDFLKEGKS